MRRPEPHPRTGFARRARGRFYVEYTGDGTWAVVDRHAAPGGESHVGWFGTRAAARAHAHARNHEDPPVAPTPPPSRAEARRTPYVVTDTWRRTTTGTFPILGRFATPDAASRYIGTLPDHKAGRYGLDGPDVV